jgi:hypothetical protein
MTASMAISRHRSSHAPFVAGVATGAALHSNSRRTDASPSRWRALHNAEGSARPVPFPRADEPQPTNHLAHQFFVGLAQNNAKAIT